MYSSQGMFLVSAKLSDDDGSEVAELFLGISFKQIQSTLDLISIQLRIE